MSELQQQNKNHSFWLWQFLICDSELYYGNYRGNTHEDLRADGLSHYRVSMPCRCRAALHTTTLLTYNMHDTLLPAYSHTITIRNSLKIQSFLSLLTRHFGFDWSLHRNRPQNICECVYKIPCRNCNKAYNGETGWAFGVWLQEHRQEVSQREVRAYTRSTSRSLAGEQNKSAVTDHAISLSLSLSLNHVIDWDQAKVIDRESSRVDRWIKEAIHIRKEQDNSMNRDEGSYQLSHIYDNLFTPKLSSDDN